MAKVTEYTREAGEAVCEALLESRSLRAVCGRRGFPTLSAVCGWLVRETEFQRQYAAARRALADVLAEEILEIADDTREDFVTKEVRGKEVEAFQAENVSRSRLRVDARKWLAAKLSPAVYGTSGDPTAETEDPVQALFDGIRRQ